MAEVLKTGVPVRNQEAVIEREDGERRVVLVNIDPIKNAEGLLIGAVNCFSDISGRRRAEQEREELGEARQRLAAIVETSEDAIISKNLDGIILTWNKGAERIFGYTAAEAVGRHITLLIPEDRHYEEDNILARLKAGKRIEHYDTVRRRKDGELRDISLSVSPIRDSSGSIIGASKIARDITESKRAQAQQELLSRELQHRTRNIFTVVHSLVHCSLDGRRNITETLTRWAVMRSPIRRFCLPPLGMHA